MKQGDPWFPSHLTEMAIGAGLFLVAAVVLLVYIGIQCRRNKK